MNARKTILTVVILSALSFSSRAGAADQQYPDDRLTAKEREKLWTSYARPAGQFSRFLSREHGVIFWYPADWTRSAATPGQFLTEGAYMHVVVEQIPAGMDIENYTTQLLHSLRSKLAAPRLLLNRQIHMAGLPGREIVMDSTRRGFIFRTTLRVVMGKATAYIFIFGAREVLHQVLEPHFKRAMESSTILEAVPWCEEFEAIRTELLKEELPDEIVRKVEELLQRGLALEENDGFVWLQEAADMAAANPAVFIDFLLHENRLVRAAAVRAIASSKSWEPAARLFTLMLRDPDSCVSMLAGKKLLKLGTQGLEALTRAISKAPPDDAHNLLSVCRWAQGNTLKTILAAAFARGEPAFDTAALQVASAHESRDVDIPWDRLLASDDKLTRNLAISLLPRIRPDYDMDRLVDFLNPESDILISCSVLRCLARCGSNKHLDVIEASVKSAREELDRLKRTFEETPSARTTTAAARYEDLETFVETGDATIEIIRLRSRIAGSEEPETTAILNAALADEKTRDWAQEEIMRRLVSPTLDFSKLVAGALSDGERIFPRDLTIYMCLPSFERSLAALGNVLDEIQLENTADQARFLVVARTLREKLRASYIKPDEADPETALGFVMNSPVALAAWKPSGTPPGFSPDWNVAAVVEVSDRERFESFFKSLACDMGNPQFAATQAFWLPRFLSSLPIVFASVIKDEALKEIEAVGEPRKRRPLATTCHIANSECVRFPVVIFNTVCSYDDGSFDEYKLYVAYIGSLAICAASPSAITDILAVATGTEPALAENELFRHAREEFQDAPAFFFTNPSALGGHLDALEKSTRDREAIHAILGKIPAEYGCLSFGTAAIENLFRLKLEKQSLFSALEYGSAKEFRGPAELLPASTILSAHLFVNQDKLWKFILETGMDDKKREVFLKTWAVDFDDIRKAFDQEIGLAMLNVPVLDDELGERHPVLFAGYVHLKSDEPVRLARAGRLFAGGVEIVSPADSPVVIARIPDPDSGEPFYIGVCEKFMTISNRKESLDLLGPEPSLSSVPQYKQVVAICEEKLSGLVFVNIGGGLAEAMALARGHASVEQLARMIATLVEGFSHLHGVLTARGETLELRLSASLDRTKRLSLKKLETLVGEEKPLSYASVVPSGVELVPGEEVSRLRMRLKVAHEDMVKPLVEDLSDGGRQVAQVESERTVVLCVERGPTQVKESVALPVSGSEFAPALRSTPEISADTPAIKEKAKELLGNTRNSFEAAAKFAAWIRANVEWAKTDDADAADVLARREADCEEQSELFCALARASGLPARICKGLAFSGGKFGAHAWVEVFVGKWVEMDPTWGVLRVGASHIRSRTGLLLVLAMLGALSIELLEVEYDPPEWAKDPVTLVRHMFDAARIGNTREYGRQFDLQAMMEKHIETEKLAERAALVNMFKKGIQTGLETAAQQLAQFPSRLLNYLVTEENSTVTLMFNVGGKEIIKCFHLLRRNQRWKVVELECLDTGLSMASMSSKVLAALLSDESNGKPVEDHDDLQTLLSFISAIKKLEQQDFAGAIKDVEAFLARKENFAPAHNVHGWGLVGMGKVDDAVASFKKAIAVDESFAPAYMALGVYYNSKGQQKEAMRAFENAIRWELRDPRPHRELADIYEKAGRLDDAEKRYREAVSLDMEGWVIRNNFGYFLARQGRFDEAIELYYEAFRLYPGSEVLFSNIADALYKNGDFDDLHDLLSENWEILRGDFLKNYYMALSLYQLGRAGEAIPFMRKAVELEPEHENARQWLCILLKGAGNWEALLARAEEELKANDKLAWAAYYKACAYARLGRKGAALESLQKAISLDPELAITAGQDEDLASLKDSEEFKRLVADEAPGEESK